MKKLSAIILSTLFATMQISMADPIDLGLGASGGGAVINHATGGFESATSSGGVADINFTGSSHVYWDKLNLDQGETMNFNAINGANGINVLNTVSGGMSSIYGQINANSGIGKLIISNPNGIIFDGARFTAAGGDINLTTQPMTSTIVNGVMNISRVDTANAVGTINIKDSDFTTTGEFNILAPQIEISNTASHKITANKGMKLITANGQDYLAVGNTAPMNAVVLDAVNVDGDVYVVSDKGYVKLTNGGQYNGNLNIKSDDSIVMNYNSNGKKLNVTGDVNATGNGWAMYLRNAKVDGNVNMQNGGGFLEVGNATVGKDLNMKTIAQSENSYGYKHFTHLVGKNDIGGNVNIDSKDNIHIGNYVYEDQELLNGYVNVGGDLNAHAHDGHVTVTINTTADKINLKSDNLNVLSSDNALLTANEYKFSANGYIGAISDYTKDDNTVITADQQIVSLMENYTRIPSDIKSHSYMNIAGGKITQLDTPNNSEVYIASKGNVELTGANAGNINLTAVHKRVDITGDDVHAKNINIGNDTDVLKVEFPSRDYTLNYTNIRDGQKVTVNPDDEITYTLTNAPGGYNGGQSITDHRTDVTYLVGPDAPTPPTPPTPDPDPRPTPSPDPEPEKNLMTQWVPEDSLAAPINTPVAYAADLDDDELDKAVRKNVDGSVTVVRAFPMMN